MKIYTKTGDAGETSLFTGDRVSKSNPLVDVFGRLDELNSYIGLLSNKSSKWPDILSELKLNIDKAIQNLKILP